MAPARNKNKSNPSSRNRSPSSKKCVVRVQKMSPELISKKMGKKKVIKNKPKPKSIAKKTPPNKNAIRKAIEDTPSELMSTKRARKPNPKYFDDTQIVSYKHVETKDEKKDHKKSKKLNFKSSSESIESITDDEEYDTSDEEFLAVKESLVGKKRLSRPSNTSPAGRNLKNSNATPSPPVIKSKPGPKSMKRSSIIATKSATATQKSAVTVTKAPNKQVKKNEEHGSKILVNKRIKKVTSENAPKAIATSLGKRLSDEYGDTPLIKRLRFEHSTRFNKIPINNDKISEKSKKLREALEKIKSRPRNIEKNQSIIAVSSSVTKLQNKILIEDAIRPQKNRTTRNLRKSAISEISETKKSTLNDRKLPTIESKIQSNKTSIKSSSQGKIISPTLQPMVILPSKDKSESQIQSIDKLSPKKQILSQVKTVTPKTTPSPKQLMPIAKKAAIAPKLLSSPKQNAKIATKMFPPEPIEPERDVLADVELKAASTFEDFETMPTFTIVNVNDIIGKKGEVEVVVSETDAKNKKQEKEMQKKSQKKVTAATRRKTIPQNLLSDSDLSRTSSPEPQKRTTRSKANTNLLTKTTSPPKKQFLHNNAMKKAASPTYTLAKTPSGGYALKESPIKKDPPRILNSTLNRSPTILTKSEQNRSIQQKSQEKSKENVELNKNLTKPIIQRKFPPEKVVISRQGNKTIKKITCFETWYVIDIPKDIKNISNQKKNNLDISLMTLGNQANTITLPNDKWTRKITLTRVPPNQLNVIKEKYDGEVYDKSIPENEKDKYQPLNVMFRRINEGPDRQRLPFDRAIIFKNNSYFTNIDGKNIRLIGAPNEIKNFEDIEILLEIMDDLDLKSGHVETTTFVL